jgi:hypothetical protein
LAFHGLAVDGRQRLRASASSDCFSGFAAVSPPPPLATVQPPPQQQQQQVPLPPFQAEPAPTSLTKNMPPSSGGASGTAARAAAAWAWYRPIEFKFVGKKHILQENFCIYQR